MKRLARISVGALCVVGLLAWLRDPAWLTQVESGFGRWETDASGAVYRWTAGRASFFVPADLVEARIPIRLPMESLDWPVIVTIAIDDRPADQLRIVSGDWHVARLPLPPPGSRHLRRIDIHVDRTRQGNRGVQVGAVELVRR
jgi:hypothetical protein